MKRGFLRLTAMAAAVGAMSVASAALAADPLVTLVRTEPPIAEAFSSETGAHPCLPLSFDYNLRSVRYLVSLAQRFGAFAHSCCRWNCPRVKCPIRITLGVRRWPNMIS